MRKIFLIAYYDLVQLLRDRVALIFMLALPFGLTLVAGAAFGNNGELQDIPVVVVNQDTGFLGSALTEMLQSDTLRPLLATQVYTDPRRALEQVRRDQAAAAVIITPAAERPGPPLTATVPFAAPAITLVANPSRPVGSAVVRAIVRRFVDGVNTHSAAGALVFATLAREGALPQDEEGLQTLGEAWSREAARAFGAREPAARLVPLDESRRAFDPLAYFAPSMAIFALMFTMTQGGSVLLVEREGGTLARMLATPTRPATILAGKLIGLWLGGWAQLAVLLSVSAVLFNVTWGDPPAVILVCFALVLAASGWGLLIAAVARTTGEAQAAGIIVSLVFGLTAGHFFPRDNLPIWLQQAGRISPNAWGLESFLTLLEGGGVADVLGHVAALLAMAMLLFGLAGLGIRRQLEM